MEREAVRDGEERPRGQSVLIPGASPPLTLIGTPVP